LLPLRAESTAAAKAVLDISVIADNGPGAAQMTAHPESAQKAQARAEVLSIVVEAH
jgi:hypothetical protein